MPITLNEIFILNECNYNYPRSKSEIINDIPFKYNTEIDYFSCSILIDQMVVYGLLYRDSNFHYQITNRGQYVLNEEKIRLTNISGRLNFSL